MFVLLSITNDVMYILSPGDGVRSFTHPLYTSNSILDLDLNTNARSLGAYMYRVDGNEIIEPTNGTGSIHCI